MQYSPIRLKIPCFKFSNIFLLNEVSFCYNFLIVVKNALIASILWWHRLEMEQLPLLTASKRMMITGSLQCGCPIWRLKCYVGCSEILILGKFTTSPKYHNLLLIYGPWNEKQRPREWRETAYVHFRCFRLSCEKVLNSALVGVHQLHA